jgi:hypothetical protein
VVTTIAQNATIAKSTEDLSCRPAARLEAGLSGVPGPLAAPGVIPLRMVWVTANFNFILLPPEFCMAFRLLGRQGYARSGVWCVQHHETSAARKPSTSLRLLAWIQRPFSEKPPWLAWTGFENMDLVTIK